MKEQIKNRMDVTDEMAEKLEKKLSDIDSSLEHILTDWLINGNEDSDEEFEGYSINSLKDKFGFKFSGALLTLDWLIKEPQIAKEAIKKGIK